MSEQFDMFEDGGMFLAKLRRNWRDAVEKKGAICPCCDRKGKVYRIKLNHTYALSVLWIFKNGGDDGWVDVQNRAPRWMLKGKNYGMLAHWGFLESKSHRSGIWRVTQMAKDWIAGNIGASESIYIYDNKLWGASDEETSFRSCIRKYFDFDEVMSSQFNWANIKGKQA